MNGHIRRRKMSSHIVSGLAIVAAAISLFLLASILFTLLSRGLPALSLGIFTMSMAPTGIEGGLANAIVGSLIQVSIGLVLAIPIGILAGTYLAEYGRSSRLANATRFVSDILLSAPSILVGLFVYTLLVEPFRGYSGIAGAVALAIIAIPMIIRTTEDMLSLVPLQMREASAALGAPKYKTITRISWRAAAAGITTGVLLALARIAGETAPLLFTSLGNLNWSTSLTKPMASLPVAIYQYAASPYDDLVSLAWAGALVITVTVLILNIIAQSLVKRHR